MSYSEALLRLCTNPTGAQVPDLWDSLPRDDQKRALSLAVEESSSARTDLASRFVRSQGGFRLATVRGWSTMLLVEKALRHRILTPWLMEMAIVQLHLNDRRDLQAAFFTKLGLPHSEGVPLASIPEPAASSTELAAAAADLLAESPSDRALFYLLALRILMPKSWGELSTPLRAFGTHARPAEQEPPGPALAWHDQPSVALERSGKEVLADDVSIQPQVVPTAPSLQEEQPGAGDGFTELDHLIMHAIEDSRNEIEGALAPTQLDEALLELSRLNGTRARTHFHIGLRDLTFGRGVAASALSGRGSKWGWYFAGYISGLHDTGDHRQIVSLFDTYDEVRQLGSSNEGPSEIAAHMVLRALCREERFAEAVGFLDLDSITVSATLQDALLDEATDLVRGERYDQALPMLQALESALKLRIQRGLHVPRDRWNDTRRRLATCLRFVGAPGAAVNLLMAILSEAEQGDDNRAAVLTDLGLEESGFARLHELHLPPNKGDLKELADRLSASRRRFEEALLVDSELARHADYVLGFLALVGFLASEHGPTEVLEGSIPKLGAALGHFEKRPAVYKGGKLISRARLHLAIAYCLACDEARIPRAQRLLEDALTDSLAPPLYLVDQVLIVLEAKAHSGESVDWIVTRMLDSRPELLDAISKLEFATRVPALPDCLMARAGDSRRSLEERRADRVAAFGCLRRQGRLDEAGAVLDELEREARRQVGTDDYLNLIADREAIQDIWPDEEVMRSRAIVLEWNRDLAAAAEAWANYAHRLMSIGTIWALDNAATAIDQVRRLGPDFDSERNALSARLARLAPPAASTTSTARIKAHVLIVGGDEQSRKEMDQIRDEVADKAPGVTLEFMTTGFTSNWGRLVEEFERRVERADAVVVNYLMRTNFGRTIRKLCAGKPWRSCDTRGRGKMVDRILAVAAAAAA